MVLKFVGGGGGGGEVFFLIFLFVLVMIGPPFVKKVSQNVKTG